MKGYSVEIKSASKELSTKERIMYKDTSECIKLDDVLGEDNFILIKPVDYVVLQVHNEKSSNKDYTTIVLITETGERYITGSESFIESFENVWDDITDLQADGEDYQLKLYKKESKNYKGKFFITCSVF